MKRILLSTLLALTFLSAISQTKKPATKKPSAKVSSSTSAQKFAYIYEDYVYENYKAVKKLDEDLKQKQEAYQESFNKMAIEYQTLYIDYQTSIKNIDSLTTEKLNEKLRKVQETKTASENFQREAEKELQQYTGDAIMKIRQEVKTAAEQVAKEKGLHFVFSRNKSDGPMTSGRVILYAGDNGTGNISDIVLAKLGSLVQAAK
ncbi:OmpH family outer membrane protein [Lacihabitans sp. LS3-19]|uniref:OmpH family outer membrane protein n=2 Tax=Lacihabitans sp. LS3-19 TaxID=2487335 RepID=UPI0020CFBFA8|nr:OmpH family outer membrane protein [Lacihabitans sp. LS3-19]MCP9769343.1 OmpH family outer membrane protein [Lacihabitans sp. LS3-19]